MRTDHPFAVESVDPSRVRLAGGTTGLRRPKADRRVPVVAGIASYSQNRTHRRGNDELSAGVVWEYRCAITSCDAEAMAHKIMTAVELPFPPIWRPETRERGLIVQSAAATGRIRRGLA